ncbi:MAG: hypothetical protein J1F16_11170 [Muribaculaceae bacterium]|nr:hypothetical protein [Muribaculaceae bacterium]
MNKDSLTDYLKVTQLVLPEYHPLRIIAEGVSKGLIEQKTPNHTRYKGLLGKTI